MSRQLLRLVSCMSLVAYFLANTHLNLVFAAFAKPTCCAGTEATNSTGGESKENKPRKCKHCAQRDASDEAPTDKKQPKNHDSNCPGCPDSPLGHSCPCCPQGDHSCPVPGGCAMCTIAKAPCLTPNVAADLSGSALFEFVPDLCFSYASPLSDSMARPPKA